MRLFFVAAISFIIAAGPLAAADHPPKGAKPSEPSHSVIHLAPDFAFPAAGNKPRTLRGLHGQPVVLFIAKSPTVKPFRKELEQFDRKYSRFASEQVIFVAAFRQGDGPVKSDVPFSVALNGGAVADAYGMVGDFNAVIIGRDGNIDAQTSSVLTAQRIIDIIQNSYVPQAQTRKRFVQ